MKVGDLVKFKRSGKICLYLGYIAHIGCYRFWHEDWGNCDLAPSSEIPMSEKVEVINATQ